MAPCRPYGDVTCSVLVFSELFFLCTLAPHFVCTIPSDPFLLRSHRTRTLGAGSALTWQGVKFEFASETLILLPAPAPENVSGRRIEGKLQQVPA